MAHTALTPVFAGLRAGLHILFVALAVLVLGRAVITDTPASAAVVVLTLVLLGSYAVGGHLARRPRSGALRYLWLAALTAEWLVLVWLIPEAAYLVFPLFFIYLHVLPHGWGTAGVLGSTALAIVALGFHNGWSAGGVVGPLVGAGVAIMIGLGYRALAREAAEREQLVAELLATRDQLAATEREAGVLAERSRLAREIHDTVAQGLSSIQMLLHAAERVEPHGAGVEHVRLARETAATSLADARRFIRELAPAALIDQGLGAALRRLATDQWERHGLVVQVRVSDSLDMPMHIQTALLRITQGAMANAIQHADARSATITITRDAASVHLTVADDGRGFDREATAAARAAGSSDSFGLTAAQERVDQLGGTLDVDTAPGRGTVVSVELRLEDE